MNQNLHFSKIPGERIAGMWKFDKHYSNILDQGSANYNSWVKSGQLPVFVNQVLLEHSYTYLFMNCWWLFTHYNGRAG